MTVPGGSKVPGQVARREELVRRREAGDRGLPLLGDQQSVGDGQRPVGSPGVDLLPLELPLGIDPRQSHAAHVRQRQPRVIKDRASVLLGPDHGLQVDKPGAGVERQLELARERPGRQVADGHRRPAAVAHDADRLESQLRLVRLVGPPGWCVEERVEGAHPGRPVWGSDAAAHHEEGERIDILEHHGGGGILRPGGAHPVDQRPARSEVDSDGAGLVSLAVGPVPRDAQPITVPIDPDSTVRPVAGEVNLGQGGPNNGRHRRDHAQRGPDDRPASAKMHRRIPSSRARGLRRPDHPRDEPPIAVVQVRPDREHAAGRGFFERMGERLQLVTVMPLEERLDHADRLGKCECRHRVDQGAAGLDPRAGDLKQAKLVGRESGDLLGGDCPSCVGVAAPGADPRRTGARRPRRRSSRPCRSDAGRRAAWW